MSFIDLSMLNALSAGLRIEPLLHPKPGAVTRISSHEDKNVIDFCEHAIIIENAMLRAFIASRNGERDPFNLGLREYLVELSKLEIRTNVALGSALLHIPLASALGSFSIPPSLEELVRTGASMAQGSREGAVTYYKILEMLKPSHLRRYEGFIPGVGEGYPKSFVEVLHSARWDLVHSELLNGYRMSLETYKILEEEYSKDEDIERSALVALLNLLANYGDTLILEKFGIRSYMRAIEESREALLLSKKFGIRKALEILDSRWRQRNWNPGASLDILATAISLFYYNLFRKRIFGLGYHS